MLKDTVTPELQKYLARIIIGGYALTQKIKKADEIFNWMLGQEVLPYVRRVAIDFLAFRGASSINGLVAGICPNRSGNYHHVELCYKEHLILTISHLASINGKKQTFPRPALFREDLSRFNPNQIEIFPSYPQKYFGDNQVLAMLVHEGNLFPEKASIIVPDAKCKKAIDGLSINLSNRNINSDINEITAIVPEFIEFAKEKSK